MELSSGAVIFRKDKYLVLKYGHGHWGFVKGHVEKNEDLKETFFREAYEETALKKKNLHIINGFKEKISYNYKRKNNTVYKEVIYFLAESNTYDIYLSHEHTDFKWLEYDKAYRKVNFENDRKVLRKAELFLKNQ